MPSVLEAPLPARWGRVQRLKNAVIVGLVRVAFTLARAAPFGVLRAGMRLAGNLAYLVDGKNRRRAITNLARAFPEWTPPKRRRVARLMFVHLAETAAEAVHLHRFVHGAARVTLSAAQRQLLDEALARGQGVMAVSGHIGNWELLAQVIAAAGYPAFAVAKPLYDPRLTRWAHAQRSRFGLQILWRGDDGVAKDMLRVFHDNAILGLLIDQDTRVQGIFVPFFGRPAHTPAAAAALALRTGAPVVIAWSQRVGKLHRVHLELCEPHDLGLDPVTALTARITARLEAAIRDAPEQWVWLHDRWRQQPPG